MTLKPPFSRVEGRFYYGDSNDYFDFFSYRHTHVPAPGWNPGAFPSPNHWAIADAWAGNYHVGQIIRPGSGNRWDQAFTSTANENSYIEITKAANSANEIAEDSKDEPWYSTYDISKPIQGIIANNYSLATSYFDAESGRTFDAFTGNAVIALNSTIFSSTKSGLGSFNASTPFNLPPINFYLTGPDSVVEGDQITIKIRRDGDLKDKAWLRVGTIASSTGWGHKGMTINVDAEHVASRALLFAPGESEIELTYDTYEDSENEEWEFSGITFDSIQDVDDAYAGKQVPWFSTVEKNVDFFHTHAVRGGFGGAPSRVGYYVTKVWDKGAAPGGQGNGSNNVHRFCHVQKGTHLYTADEVEKDTIISNPGWGYRYEGVAYKSLGSGNTELYRFYNRRKNYHFLTTSKLEADVITGNPGWGYKSEGRSFAVSTTKTQDAPLEVHRFYHQKKGVHFYTANAIEAETVIKNSLGIGYSLSNAEGEHDLLKRGWGYQYEGVAWYAADA